ncbi:MAG: S8 family serine peptidase, partial [Planctomycetes bacterium]|nr:S8 family serine peptidase [Planctomycetota bacterium]
MFREGGVDCSKLSQANRGGATGAAIERIVRDLESAARADQAGFIETVQALGGTVVHNYWLINGCAVSVPPAAVAAITADARVSRVYPDALRSPAAMPIRTSTNALHHGSDAAQAAGVLGEGVTVAIVDTGFDAGSNPQGRPHLAFYANGTTGSPTSYGVSGSRIAATYTIGALPATQEDRHGTGVCGVAAGAKWSTSLFECDDGHSPRATLALWSIADIGGGGALESTMIAAWQSVVAQRSAKRIVAANMSYEGTPNPMGPLALAIDAAGREDILVTLIAGNYGPDTSFSQIVNNGISVGAVDAAKSVAWFSCRGPMNGRPFPDIVAHGVDVYMPNAEDENNLYFRSGTSFAAPQVAGAATMYRGLCNESALVTRAAILATTESVAAQNPGLGRNAYGVGYLRVDRLVDVARGNRWARTARLYAPGNYDYAMPVTAGATYNLALTWSRQLSLPTWSNLRLEVRNGAQVIVSANDPLVTFERTRFVAPITGFVQVRIVATTIEDPTGGIPVALICPEAREPAIAWVPSSQTLHPPGRRGHAMAFDAPQARTILFGGESTTGFLDDQWEFDGTQWVERVLLTRPSARSGHAMAWDSVRNKVVLFGGNGGSGDLGDTFEFHLLMWNNVSNSG